MKVLLGLLLLFAFFSAFGLGRPTSTSPVAAAADDEEELQDESEEDFLARQRAAEYEDHYTPELDPEPHAAADFVDSE